MPYNQNTCDRNSLRTVIQQKTDMYNVHCFDLHQRWYKPGTRWPDIMMIRFLDL